MSIKKQPPYKLATPAPTDPRQRYVYQLIYGPTDSGKTTYALTAPGPICYCHCSGKVEGVLQLANKRHIKQHGYPIGELDFGFPAPDVNAIKPHSKFPKEYYYADAVERAAAAKWQEFVRVQSEAFTWAKTIIIDTEFALYQLLRFGFFGDDSPNFNYERDFKGTDNVNLQALWGPVNREWYLRMRQAVRSQVRGVTNVVLVTQAGDEYKDVRKPGKRAVSSTKTGNLQPQSQKRIPYWVDCSVETRIDQLSSGRAKHYVKIHKPWGNKDARGVELDVTDNEAAFGDVMFEIKESDLWYE